MPCIYKITNCVNQKFYIGKTNRNNPLPRWNGHLRKVLDKSYRHPLYDSIRRYGPEKFLVEVLEECSMDILNLREKFWIKKLVPEYNLTAGGDGGDTFTCKPEHMKEKTRKKLSDAAKKNTKNPEYIRKLSDASKRNAQNPEYIRKLSDAGKRLVQNPDYLKKVSDGVKAAIKIRKDVWSECKRGSKNGRWLGKIEMYDNGGKLYKTYETAVECKKDTGIVAHHIRNKARTGQPVQRGPYAGYTFRFNRDI